MEVPSTQAPTEAFLEVMESSTEVTSTGAFAKAFTGASAEASMEVTSHGSLY